MEAVFISTFDVVSREKKRRASIVARSVSFEIAIFVHETVRNTLSPRGRGQGEGDSFDSV
jgi:hypothetical protein